MKYQEYINKVLSLEKKDISDCRTFIRNETRFTFPQGKKESKQANVKLIFNKGSFFQDHECLVEIMNGIDSILECEEKLTNKKLAEDLKKEKKEANDKINEIIRPFPHEDELNDEVVVPWTNESIYERDIERSDDWWNHYAKEILDALHNQITSFYKKRRPNELIKGLFPQLPHDSNDKKSPKFREMYEKDLRKYLEINNTEILDKYNLHKRVEGDFYLGFYKHKGEIEIHLDPIFDTALSIGVDPYLLYRKVLIHEIAHATHHRGTDANNRIWVQFVNDSAGRVFMVEGLAQFYTLHYMWRLDMEEIKQAVANRNTVPLTSQDRKRWGKNLKTLFAMSHHQSKPYQYYMEWYHQGYDVEMMRVALTNARKNDSQNVSLMDFEKILVNAKRMV